MADHQKTTQALQTARQQAHSDLQDLRSDRTALADRLAVADQAVALLEQVVSRLSDLAASLDEEAHPSTPQARRTSRAQEPRTQAVLRILEEAGPLSSAEVTQKLQDEGRSDTRKQVSGTLSSLARKQWAAHDATTGTWSRV